MEGEGAVNVCVITERGDGSEVYNISLAILSSGTQGIDIVE